MNLNLAMYIAKVKQIGHYATTPTRTIVTCNHHQHGKDAWIQITQTQKITLYQSGNEQRYVQQLVKVGTGAMAIFIPDGCFNQPLMNIHTLLQLVVSFIQMYVLFDFNAMFLAYTSLVKNPSNFYYPAISVHVESQQS